MSTISVIGAGYVAAFVQTWVAPPLVREFQTVGEDISQFGRWWQNRLLKIFLVFILTTLGSPNRRAADADRSYAVRAVAPPNPLIRVGTDLASHPAFLATIKTAERLPGTTIIGPSFNGAEGDREFPIAVLSSLGDAPGVVVATLKLEPFFAATTQDQASSGIGLRLIEYDARSGTDPLRTAVIASGARRDSINTGRG